MQDPDWSHQIRRNLSECSRSALLQKRKRKVRNRWEYYRSAADPYRKSLSCPSHRKPRSLPWDNWSSLLPCWVPDPPEKIRSLPDVRNSWNRNAAYCRFSFLPHHRYRWSVRRGKRVRRCNRYAHRSDSHVPVQNKPWCPLHLQILLRKFSESSLSFPFFYSCLLTM